MSAYQLIIVMAAASSASNQTDSTGYVRVPYETFFTLLLAISLIVLLIGIILLVLRRVRRFVELQADQAASALRFEGSMLQEFGGVSRQTGDMASPATEQTGSVDELRGAGRMKPSPGCERAELERAVAELIKKLQASGIFVGTEGTVSLEQGDAQAQIVRLQENKLGLIIPTDDSEELVGQDAKRFDYIFVVPGNDQVLVIQKYQDFIADKIPLY
jgi:type II secretory pathway pseudopilin PulG